MRQLFTTRKINVPEDVTVDVKSRVVTVTGPLGTLTRAFKHMSLDIRKSEDGRTITLTSGLEIVKQLLVSEQFALILKT